MDKGKSCGWVGLGLTGSPGRIQLCEPLLNPFIAGLSRERELHLCARHGDVAPCERLLRRSRLAVQGTLLLNLLVASLWYAPVAAFLLLVSAWAPRAVLLWASLPPVLLMIAERTALGTAEIAAFLGYRLTAYFEAIGAAGTRAASPDTAAQVAVIGDLYNRISVAPLLANIDLWLGVVAAAVMLWGAIRLRRWRDDG